MLNKQPIHPTQSTTASITSLKANLHKEILVVTADDNDQNNCSKKPESSEKQDKELMNLFPQKKVL